MRRFSNGFPWVLACFFALAAGGCESDSTPETVNGGLGPSIQLHQVREVVQPSGSPQATPKVKHQALIGEDGKQATPKAKHQALIGEDGKQATPKALHQALIGEDGKQATPNALIGEDGLRP